MKKYTAIDFIKEINLYSEYLRILKIRNKDIDDSKRKEWVEKNREKIREYQRKYAEKNRDKINKKSNNLYRSIRGLPLK